MDASIREVQATSALSSSLYFWWLAYLRCSKDYWWCCQQKGRCEDERLVSVYSKFGDVFKYRTLLDWWSDYGAHLFDSPQIEMDFVTYLPSGVEVLISQDLIQPRLGMLCFAIPLGLDHQKAIASILEVWDVANIRGQHYMQDAQYQLQPIDFKSKQGSVRFFVFEAFSRLVHGGGRRLRRTADAVVKSFEHCYSTGLINLSP